MIFVILFIFTPFKKFKALLCTWLAEIYRADTKG